MAYYARVDGQLGDQIAILGGWSALRTYVGDGDGDFDEIVGLLNEGVSEDPEALAKQCDLVAKKADDSVAHTAENLAKIARTTKKLVEITDGMG
jgi:hypothetical protein